MVAWVQLICDKFGQRDAIDQNVAQFESRHFAAVVIHELFKS